MLLPLALAPAKYSVFVSMGCASTKQTSHSAAADAVAVKQNQALAATLLKSQQNEQKAVHTKTSESPAAAQVSHQDRVTKVNSNVMMVEFTQLEDDDEVEQTSVSTRKSKRKATPWHGGGGAAVDFDDDEIDDDDSAEDEVAEPQQPTTQEAVDRKAVRKATPWHKGGAALESDLDDDREQEHKEHRKETEGAPDAGSVLGFFEVCCRPCIALEEVVVSSALSSQNSNAGFV